MNIYKVTFHTSFGASFSTNVEGKTLEDAMENIMDKSISSNTFLFEDNDNPDNKAFVMKTDQVFYTEYELIESNEQIMEDEGLFGKDFELFSFNEFVKLSDDHIQKVMQHIPSDELLARALKKAKSDVGIKFFDSMDRTKKLSFTVADESLGNISKIEIEKAQKEIVNIALQLAAEGEIVLQ